MNIDRNSVRSFASEDFLAERQSNTVALNGRIWVESDLDAGSRIYFTVRQEPELI